MTPDVFDDIPIGLCLLRRDRKNLTCLYANRRLEGMLGAELKGKNLEDFWPGEEAADLARRLKSPTPPNEATLPFETLKGKRWTLVTITPEIHNREECYALWATDISTSKAAEESLKQAISQADAIAEQKSNFLATVSHEIRTPMQTIYGLLEMIELESGSQSTKSMAKTARNSASGLLEILNDVLDFAKMDADKMELDHFEVPVRTLVRGILEAVAVKVHGKNVELKDDIGGDVPFVIVGDPKRLRQVLINLMGNAVKFTKEGSIVIRAVLGGKTLPAPAHGIVLRFEVEDTGIGMEPDVASRLFQPFMQADNSTSRKYGGTGLGLSICKKLVELMGGAIGVDSEPGKGSVFWFEIPTEEVGTETNILDMPDLDGISVLSVEDHPMGAKEIVKSLQSMGASVESCATVKEALELVKRRPFDVGVIDQGLPDGLGLDLIRQIIDVRPFMGLVMYTVRDDPGLQHSLQSLGVSYLAKPASRIGLGEAVRDAARQTAKIDENAPKKLLIAEDTLAVQDVLRRQLASFGVEADFVEDGRAAHLAVRSGEYGILITDLHMPEMDGYALVKAVRADDEKLDRHFPVIALTADVQMTPRQVYMEHGFDECLLKPVSLGQLKRLLIRWGLLEENNERPAPQTKAPSSSQSGASSVIDRDAMVQQMGAFDETAVEMLKMFIDMTRPLLGKIPIAWKNGDDGALKEYAHSLKGAARSACLNALGDIAAELQDAAAEKRGNYDALINGIETEFKKAEQEIALL
jgi:two-component system sensor histidine kinase/response regulator